MKLSNEDFIANTLLTTLNNKFKINQDRQVTMIPGSSIINDLEPKFQKSYQDCLTGTINQLKKHLNLKTVDIEPFNKISETVFYYTIFDKNTNELIAMIPFSQFITELSFMYLVLPNQDKKIEFDELDKIKTETIQNMVFGEIDRYRSREKQIESEVINSIEYKGLENNPYNIIIKFTLPIDDVKEPLRSVIKDSIKHKKTVDYKKISKPTLQILDLSKDKKHINFVVSLY